MSHTSFLLAASCGSLLASMAFWASGDAATTGSAACAADVMARSANAAANSLMSSLLRKKRGPFYCESACDMISVVLKTLSAALVLLAVWSGQNPRPAPTPAAAPRWPDGRINLGAPPGEKGVWD